MKIIDVKQHSQEWIEARCAIPTASEFHNLITPKGKIRDGEMPKSYLARKLAEKWGGPLPGFGSWAMDNGNILEGEALPYVEFEYNWQVQRVGFITTDDGRVGCSPDGLIGDFGGIEVKCPEAPTHVRYLMARGIPDDYAAQVQGSMFVTGRKQWTFLSYRRHYPPLIVHAVPDEEFQESLASALMLFCNDLQQSWDYLVELNGGPPPRRIPMTFSDEIRRGAEYADLEKEVVP